ncbi:MAG: class D beta-lactamase [Rickettsiales bacterium]|nr:class D beta-lactamase [Rickettsiales bacterium]
MTVLKKLVVLIMLFSTQLVHSETGDDHDIDKILKQHKATGTIIIASQNRIEYIFNLNRAKSLLSPASTFKIPNSIIAIETGAIKDQNEIVPWDRTKYDIETWNQDQTLRTAFKYSCFPTYQYLAGKIGVENYNIFLKKLQYGTYEINQGNLRDFWLKDKGLYTSPLDQINFLQRLYEKKLPISEHTYSILKDIMLVENEKDYKLYAKTGAATENWQGHGWYVGYVIAKGKPWFFVTNIDIHNYDDLPKRINITKEVLRKKKII